MSKSKILHKRKTPSVEGCIIEVPTNNILTQTRGVSVANSIHHSKHIYNYLKALNLGLFLSDVYLNHLLTIILSVFLRGYREKQLISRSQPLPQDNDRLFPESRKMEGRCIAGCFKKAASSKPFIGKHSVPDNRFTVLWMIRLLHIPGLRHRRFIQSKLRIFINHI